VSVSILPPEESHRAGISLVAALEARVEAARAEAKRTSRPGGSPLVHGTSRGVLAAYEDALALVRVASRGYGGD
jgi:hypothetical protein